MPKAFIASPLAETAAKWEVTASNPRVSRTHCLAILELLKDSLIEIVQSEEFGPIHIKGIEEVH